MIAGWIKSVHNWIQIGSSLIEHINKKIIPTGDKEVVCFCQK